jgi:ribosome biogenesis protein ENP2
MQVSLHQNVNIYNLTSGKSLPDWLQERKKNKRLAGGEHRIELLHDLEFPHFPRCIFRTPNGSHLFAAGDYPPRLKCFDVNQLSMKYSFNADMPILGGVSLSPDFRKFALRGEGRVITVHHSAAIIDRIRVPHIQRCLVYHENAGELVSSGTSGELFRISLETGSFVESYKTGSQDGVNSMDVFARHGLIMAACENGILEAIDPRSAKPAGQTCPSSSAASRSSSALTSVATDDGGVNFCCGSNDGCVYLYDLRLGRPLLTKQHMNGLSIIKTYFFKGRSAMTGEASYVLSADTRSLKIWSKTDGANFTTIDSPPSADIYDFCLLKAQHNLAPPYECDDSGVICMCCDTSRVQVHFIPQLGVAPKWASFLDILTEELEEKESTVVYEDFRFVSQSEMAQLGLTTEDIEGGKVRPAMHGCYVENGLYREIKAVVDPGALNRHLQENAKKRAEARWENRISKFKRKTGEEESADAVAAAAADPRFAAALAKNAAFAVDKENPEYAKLLRKAEERQAKAAAVRRRYDDEQFTVVPDATGPEDGDDANMGGVGSAAGGDDARRMLLTGPKVKTGEQRKVTMLEAKKGVEFSATDRQTHEMRKRDRSLKLSLEERLKRKTRQ